MKSKTTLQKTIESLSESQIEGILAVADAFAPRSGNVGGAMRAFDTFKKVSNKRDKDRYAWHAVHHALVAIRTAESE